MPAVILKPVILDGDFKQVHYDMEKYGWDGIALRVADVYENLKK